MTGRRLVPLELFRRQLVLTGRKENNGQNVTVWLLIQSRWYPVMNGELGIAAIRLTPDPAGLYRGSTEEHTTKGLIIFRPWPTFYLPVWRCSCHLRFEGNHKRQGGFIVFLVRPCARTCVCEGLPLYSDSVGVCMCVFVFVWSLTSPTSAAIIAYHRHQCRTTGCIVMNDDIYFKSINISLSFLWLLLTIMCNMYPS